MFHYFIIFYYFLKIKSTFPDNIYFRVYDFGLIPLYTNHCCKKEFIFADDEFDMKLEEKIIKHICQEKSLTIKKTLNMNNTNKVHKLFFELIDEIDTKSKLFDANFKREVLDFMKDNDKEILKEWYSKFLFMIKIYRLKHSNLKTLGFLVDIEKNDSLINFNLSCTTNILYFSIPTRLLAFIKDKCLNINQNVLNKVYKDLGLKDKDLVLETDTNFWFNDPKKFAEEFPKIKKNINMSSEHEIRFKLVIRIKISGVFSFFRNLKCSCVLECKCEAFKNIKRVLKNEKNNVKDYIKLINDVIKNEDNFCKEVRIDLFKEFKANIDYCASKYFLFEKDVEKNKYLIDESKNYIYLFVICAKKFESCRKDKKKKILKKEALIGSVEKKKFKVDKNSNKKDKDFTDTCMAVNKKNDEKSTCYEAKNQHELFDKYHDSPEHSNIEFNITDPNIVDKFKKSFKSASSIELIQNKNEIEENPNFSLNVEENSYNNFDIEQRIETFNVGIDDNNSGTDEKIKNYSKKVLEPKIRNKDCDFFSREDKITFKNPDTNVKTSPLHEKLIKYYPSENENNGENKNFGIKEDQLCDKITMDTLSPKKESLDASKIKDDYVDKSYSKSHLKKVLRELETRETRKRIAKEKKKEKK